MPAIKKSRKQARTTRSIIRSALRRLFLRSREHSAALKRERYTCERCGRKQCRAKGKEVYVRVHHRNGIDWSAVIDWVLTVLLPDPAELEVLCEECHKKEHEDS